MSMRSQVYEWSNLAPATQDFTLRRTTADVPKPLTANREYDLFIGGIGLNITKPAETTATPTHSTTRPQDRDKTRRPPLPASK